MWDVWDDGYVPQESHPEFAKIVENGYIFFSNFDKDYEEFEDWFGPKYGIDLVISSYAFWRDGTPGENMISIWVKHAQKEFLYQVWKEYYII